MSCLNYKPLDGSSLPPGWMDVPDAYERHEAENPANVIVGDDLNDPFGLGSIAIF